MARLGALSTGANGTLLSQFSGAATMGFLGSMFVGLLFGSCASPARPTPAESILAGIDREDWREIDAHNSFDEAVVDLAQQLPGMDGGAEVVSVLALSGGNQNGAFGAGILAVWPHEDDERANDVPARPDFHVVTCVSTGALQATTAILDDPQLDEELAHLYATSSDRDIFTKNPIRVCSRSQRERSKSSFTATR